MTAPTLAQAEAQTRREIAVTNALVDTTEARARLLAARAAALRAGAPRAAAAVTRALDATRRALKSLEGAERHAKSMRYRNQRVARCECGHAQTSHAGELHHGPCHGCDDCERFTFAGWMAPPEAPTAGLGRNWLDGMHKPGRGT